MRVVVAAVGRLKQGAERELAAAYRKRAEALGRSLGFRQIEVVEIRESRARDAERRRVEESIAIANILPDGAALILFDQGGENIDSRGLASLLQKCREENRGAVCFVIGGADGIAHSLRGRVFEIMRGHPFAGPLYPVSRSAAEVQGVKAYPSVEALPQPTDLAMLIVPAPVVAAGGSANTAVPPETGVLLGALAGGPPVEQAAASRPATAAAQAVMVRVLGQRQTRATRLMVISFLSVESMRCFRADWPDQGRRPAPRIGAVPDVAMA